ncbi:MAG: RibD family protein [Candidatus Limnocylindria bacterium]
MSPSVRRLGALGEEDVSDLHLDLLDPPGHEGRPHVALNLVLTADGRTTFRGRSEIGTRTDRALLFHLRALADLVLVGAGTVRVDPFIPAVKEERDLARRAAAGKRAQPIAAVVSGTAVLPAGNRFLSLGTERLVVTTERAPEPAVAALRSAGVDVLRIGGAEVDLAAFLGAMAERNVRLVLCEGGPMLAGALLARGLIDEVFLTHATLISAEPGARSPFETDRPLERSVRLARVSLHESDTGERYERSRISYS